LSPKFYCLTIVRSENDYCWFTVESDYTSLFIVKFFRKAKKVEKRLGRGLFFVKGCVPSLMLAKLVTKVDYTPLNYENYLSEIRQQVKELRV